MKKNRRRRRGCVIDEAPTKTASAQSVRHAINAISIRIALQSGRGCQSLFSSTDRNSSLLSGERFRFRRRVQNKRRRVSAQPFSPFLPRPSPFFHLLSSRFLSFPLSTYLLTYLLTFHARKPDVYYRACLAISVLSSSSLPPLFARKTPEQGVPFLKLPFADTPVSPVSRGVSCKRCYRPPRWKRRDAVET